MAYRLRAFRTFRSETGGVLIHNMRTSLFLEEGRRCLHFSNYGDSSEPPSFDCCQALPKSFPRVPLHLEVPPLPVVSSAYSRPCTSPIPAALPPQMCRDRGFLIEDNECTMTEDGFKDTFGSKPSEDEPKRSEMNVVVENEHGESLGLFFPDE